MRKILCLIVDDEPVARRIIEGYLAENDGYEIVGTCENVGEAQSILKSHHIDLIFLDLEMPRIHGFTFLETLQGRRPEIIITTAHRNYALKGYEFEVLDYLLKPFSFERFSRALARMDQRMQRAGSGRAHAVPDKAYLYVKVDRKMLKLPQDSILFIEGMSNYVRIYTGDEKHLVYSSLQEIMKSLQDDFIRVHKSYIVNRSKINAFSREVIEIGNRQIPIGSTYKEVIDHL